MIKNKKIKLFIKIFFTGLFLWWVIFKIDWLDVLSYLKELKIRQVALYIVLYLTGVLISSYKWKFLAGAKGLFYPLYKFFQLYFSATFINNFMPSFVGGDAFKAYELGNEEKKYKESASSVVVDRITGLWGAISLAIIFSVLNAKVIFSNEILVFINVILIFSLVISFFLLKKPSLFAILPKKARNFFQKGIGEVNSYNKESNTIPKSILISYAFNFVGLAGANYVLFQALGIEVGILDYLSMIFIISIISSIPLTINNIGIKEWAYITFFGMLGANATAVVTVVIISRILQMILSFLAWPLYLKNSRKNADKEKIKEELNAVK